MKSKISLHEPTLKGNEINYLKKSIQSSWLSQSGPFVKSFEKKISKFTKSKYAIGCINGTSALQLSLHLAGVKYGHEVIAPTITFVAPINAIKYNGADPIFMDCDNFLNIDVDKTIDFIKTKTYFRKGKTFNKRTNKIISAIIVVHVYGFPVNLYKLVKLCREKNIKIIEDSSESLGSFYKSRNLKKKHTGSIGFLGCLSFNVNKVITTGGGGMIITNDKRLAMKAKYLANQAKDDPVRFVHNSIGYNFRMTNVHAAIGEAQFENLRKILNKKKNVHKKYYKFLKASKKFNLIEAPSYSDSNFWLNIVKFKEDKSVNLIRIIKKFKSNNIEVRPVWKCNHLQKSFIKKERFKISKAEKMVSKCLCLPSSHFLKDKDIKKICKILNN